ncbi:ATP phosphoribosyltransferase regulatory subunit [Roseococcus sp. SYP-B2431]|uniref:ATP phosphoribosyltransferase regulatory subunit n=1 Tax=Roseococcus sp. SYP-B2431 TaxID=2496640 RepID=UPI001F0E6A82|nr:ATP phosphoribosyltransferase regulatory subunit [Roseococcus sp. SYP-B2431]
MDLLPPEAEQEASLVEALMEGFGRYGYERVKPPLLEFEEGLLAGSGAAVAEQTFRLMDPVSQRMMGLRADTTPQVARIAATRLGLQARPLRLCYSGQVLRVRGSELAPSRQLPQAGIELIGGAAPEADAEVALVAAEALARVGVTGITLDVTLPRMAHALLDAAGVSPALAERLVRALDRKDAAAVAALADGAGPVAALLPRLLGAAGPAAPAVEVLRSADLPESAQAIAENAAAIIEAISARAPGLRVTLDPVEFRGFQYHVGVAFTIFGPGRTGELARGGRYLSVNDEPATGMTLYPDAVLRAVPRPVSRPRCFLPLGTPAAAGAALRDQGFATVAALSAADQAGALRCTHLWDGQRAVPIGKGTG